MSSAYAKARGFTAARIGVCYRSSKIRTSTVADYASDDHHFAQNGLLADADDLLIAKEIFLRRTLSASSQVWRTTPDEVLGEFSGM
jgi:ethanolamine ammonia-lyase small subunit